VHGHQPHPRLRARPCVLQAAAARRLTASADAASRKRRLLLLLQLRGPHLLARNAKRRQHEGIVLQKTAAACLLRLLRSKLVPRRVGHTTDASSLNESGRSSEDDVVQQTAAARSRRLVDIAKGLPKVAREIRLLRAELIACE